MIILVKIFLEFSKASWLGFCHHSKRLKCFLGDLVVCVRFDL